MKMLKEYVWIHARPEDSIAKGYVVNKELTICSKYLKGVEIEFNGPKRNLNLSGDSGRVSTIQLKEKHKRATVIYSGQLQRSTIIFRVS